MFRVVPLPFSLESVLIVLGGALEVAGVVTVVVELRDSRRRVQAYLHRPQTVYLTPAYMSVTVPSPTVVTTPAPPIDTRVQRLEDGLAALRDTVEEMPTKIKSELRTDVSEASQRTSASIQDQLRPLATLIVDELNAHRGVQILGVVLIVAGIATSTAGGVLAL
jgi:hypothetical protein